MPYSPEFKLNNPENVLGNPEYLSREGFEKLQKELGNLKVELKEIAEQLEYAKSLGDLTENTEYQSAKERQALIQERISIIEDKLSRTVFISKEKNSKIQLGSIITLQKEGGTQEKYSLFGPEEADPIKGKISNESPLGSSLIDKKKGEKVQVITPNGKIVYTIIDVE